MNTVENIISAEKIREIFDKLVEQLSENGSDKEYLHDTFEDEIVENYLDYTDEYAIRSHMEDEIQDILDENKDLSRKETYREVERICDSHDFILFFGICGTWRGPRVICPYFFFDFENLSRKLYNNSYYTVDFKFLKDNIIEVDVVHHDGTNTFYILPIHSNKIPEVHCVNLRNIDKKYVIDDDYSFIKRFIRCDAFSNDQKRFIYSQMDITPKTKKIN